MTHDLSRTMIIWELIAFVVDKPNRIFGKNIGSHHKTEPHQPRQFANCVYIFSSSAKRLSNGSSTNQNPPILYHIFSLFSPLVSSLSLSLSTIRATNGSSLGVLIKVTAKQDQIKVEKDQIEAWFVVWVDFRLI